MSNPNAAPTSRWSTRILTLALVLTGLRVWLGPIAPESTAMAQLPNAGAKQNEQIEEARKTNALLTEIRDLLKSGTLNVKVTPSVTPVK